MGKIFIKAFMKRRHFLFALGSLPFATPAFAAQQWKTALLHGSFDGEAYQAGLHIALDKGWKTYWRNPGEAGIPPLIKAEASENLKTMEVLFPLPIRIIDDSGEALGYHDEVVFLLKLTPVDPAKPVTAAVSAFFGVCEKICIPAKFSGALKFVPLQQKVDDSAVLAAWAAKVPPQGKVATSAHVQGSKLTLELAAVFDEVLVEGPDQFYFRKADLSKPGKASITVDGLKSDDTLKGQSLRITAASGTQGLEQTVTVT